MRATFKAVPETATGGYLGADTWLNPLARNSHWLFGQAHAIRHLQRQGHGKTTGASTFWQAETCYRAEHPTLNFSGRIDLASGDDSVVLEYANNAGGWTAIATDTGSATDEWFDGAENKTYDASAYSLPADGILRLRMRLTGAGTAEVYHAFMSGRTDLTTWADPATFANSPTVHTAANFNTLRTCQAYLYENACQPALCGSLGTMYHQQPASYQPLMRWVFRYAGCGRLYAGWTQTLTGAGDHVYLYLEDAKYPNGPNTTTRIATLVNQDADGTVSATIDLTAIHLPGGTDHLALGGYYALELGLNEGPRVVLTDMVIADLVAGPTRTNQPKSDWAMGDQPTAAQMNTIGADLYQMHDTGDRESPIWYEHWLQTYMLTADTADGGTGQLVYYYADHRQRMRHRWRYLRYRGEGKLVSADRLSEYSLSDTATPGEAQVLDLENVRWLDYGMAYYVEDDGDRHVQVAYEDYA